MARLPGLGPRSARRAVLAMIRKRALLLDPLAQAMDEVAATVRECERCGNIATAGGLRPLRRPAARRRARSAWSRPWPTCGRWSGPARFHGRYHVLGGVMSALDGVGPEMLRIPQLVARLRDEAVGEVILALNATVDGQTTAHYIAETLEPSGLKVTSLAQGVPIGGELDYLDDGTIGAALAARRAL